MPEPDETLDAPAYEPSQPGRHWRLWSVVAVLLLGGLTLGIYILQLPYHPEKYCRLQTATLIHDLCLACESFRLENGRYPWAKSNEVGAATAICGKDVYIELRALSEAKINTQQDYLGDVKQRFLKNGALVDFWGREIMFRVDPKTDLPVIWSCGKNGIDETNDGESPDPAKFPKGYYWFGKGDTGDDITSF